MKKCPKCGRELVMVDGCWICFTRWQDCGVMMEEFSRGEKWWEKKYKGDN